MVLFTSKHRVRYIHLDWTRACLLLAEFLIRKLQIKELQLSINLGNLSQDRVALQFDQTKYFKTNLIVITFDLNFFSKLHINNEISYSNIIHLKALNNEIPKSVQLTSKSRKGGRVGRLKPEGRINKN